MSQFENMKKTGRCAATKKNLSLNDFIQVCATYLAQNRAGKSHTRRHSEQCSTVSNAEQMQTYGLSLCLSLSLSLCLSLCLSLSLSLFPCCNCRRQRLPPVQPRTTYGIAAATQRLQHKGCSSCCNTPVAGMHSQRGWLLGHALGWVVHVRLASPASLLELLLLLEPLLVPYWLDCLCLQIQQSLWLK
jgi:hypothetical protein